MKCIKCGKTIDDDSRFCYFCGAKQDRELKCDNCGHSIEFSFKHCPECGEEIDWDLKSLETGPFEFVNCGDYIVLAEPLGDVKMIEIFSTPEDFFRNLHFDEAKRYARNLRKGGYSDWRLPTIEELKMISKKTDCVIRDARYYWPKDEDGNEREWKIDYAVYSSTIKRDPYESRFDDILMFNFKTGRIEKEFYDSAWSPVVCVRSCKEGEEIGVNPCSKENFIDRGDYIELVKPINNIKMVEKISSNDEFTWNEARRYADNLRKGGFNDWQLPTIEELKTIFLIIDDICGNKSKNEECWTSEEINFNGERVSCINAAGERSDWKPDVKEPHVRCVRHFH